VYSSGEKKSLKKSAGFQFGSNILFSKKIIIVQ